MELKHDLEAEAVYISFSSKPSAYGRELDDERRIDYAADNTPIGVELLNISKGVNLDSLPRGDEISEVIEAKGIKVYEMVRYSYTTSENSIAVFNVKLALPAMRERQGHTAGIKQEVTI